MKPQAPKQRRFGRPLRLEQLENRSLLSAVPIGTELRVNQTVVGYQQTPTIEPHTVMSPGGRFRGSMGRPQRRTQSKLRYLHSSIRQGGDTPLSDEFRVNTVPPDNAPSWPTIAMSDNGNFIVSWTAPDGDNTGIFARRFDAVGMPLGEPFRVNPDAHGQQSSIQCRHG